MTYAEKLKNPLWQKRRLKVMEYAKWRCQICGAKDKTLHCHHSYYTRGKQPWQYPDGAIICICEDCHAKFHGKQKKSVKRRPAVPYEAYNYPFCDFANASMPTPVDAIPEAPTPNPERSKFGALKAMLERAGKNELAKP